ncbi:hypothetical protein J6590_020565, partial [Homalodisca vitripennis]
MINAKTGHERILSYLRRHVCYIWSSGGVSNWTVPILDTFGQTGPPLRTKHATKPVSYLSAAQFLNWSALNLDSYGQIGSLHR